MNKRFLEFSPAAGGLLLLSLAMHAYAIGDNPHIISKTDGSAACTRCHDKAPALDSDSIFNSKNLPIDPDRFKADGVAMCTGCHDSGQNHMVGKTINFAIPADLPLGPDQDVTCLTCHYTHGRLDSDRPQASFSFMDRLMDAERLHKSFLLRRNNSNGELCLTCHNVNQGSRP